MYKLFYFDVIIDHTLRASDCLKALGNVVLVRMSTPVRDEANEDLFPPCRSASVIKFRNGWGAFGEHLWGKEQRALKPDQSTAF